MPKIMTTDVLRSITMAARKKGLTDGLENEELDALEQHAYHIIDQAVHVGLYSVRCVVHLRQRGIVEPMQKTIDVDPVDFQGLEDVAIPVGEPMDFDASDGNAG